jgi:S1-C subfamily serine protease
MIVLCLNSPKDWGSSTGTVRPNRQTIPMFQTGLKSMKVLTALTLTFLFALTAAAADCEDPTREVLPQCRGTVMIETPSESGAGVTIGYADDGVFVLTARHVVKEDKSIKVSFYDKKNVWFPAHLERASEDEGIDLAVIKVVPTKGAKLPPDLPKFKVREEVRPDEWIYIISYRDNEPWQRDSTKIRRGSVNTDQRKFAYDSETEKLGISGGPVFDTTGSLMGIAYVQKNPNDGAAIKISQFWVWLQEKSHASLLTKGAVPPINTGLTSPPAPSSSPTIEVELTSVDVPANTQAGWSYQVFLSEEEKISEEEPLFKELIPTPTPSTLPPAAQPPTVKKKVVTLPREDRLLVKVVATGPDAPHIVQAQAPLDFSNQHSILVGLTTRPSAPTRGTSRRRLQRDRRSGREPALEKDSFTFYLTLKKVQVSRFAIERKPLIEALGIQGRDLNALIAEGEKTAKEADVKALRQRFHWWKIRCSLTLNNMDDLVRALKWQPMMSDQNRRPITFKAGFDEVAGTLSENVSNLEHDEVLERIENSVEYLNRVIKRLRDGSPDLHPRSVKTDGQQTSPAPVAGPEPPQCQWLRGGMPATQRPAAAHNSLARRWRR